VPRTLCSRATLPPPGTTPALRRGRVHRRLDDDRAVSADLGRRDPDRRRL